MWPFPTLAGRLRGLLSAARASQLHVGRDLAHGEKRRRRRRRRRLLPLKCEELAMKMSCSLKRPRQLVCSSCELLSCKLFSSHCFHPSLFPALSRLLWRRLCPLRCCTRTRLARLGWRWRRCWLGSRSFAELIFPGSDQKV